MPKTIEQNFADWEGTTFGYGYGTGEPHVLRALKAFFDAFGVDDRPNSYNYEKLEEAVTAPVAWAANQPAVSGGHNRIWHVAPLCLAYQGRRGAAGVHRV